MIKYRIRDSIKDIRITAIAVEKLSTNKLLKFKIKKTTKQAINNII